MFQNWLNFIEFDFEIISFMKNCKNESNERRFTFSTQIKLIFLFLYHLYTFTLYTHTQLFWNI